MLPELTSNYFELFGLPVGFDVNAEALALRYRDLQRTLHPDRFASASEQERRLSMQLATRVNEGFQTLKSPLMRARYLLELKGVAVNDTDTSMEPAFLMDQMELRETLADARQNKDFDALDRVRSEVEARDRRLLESMAAHFQQNDQASLERARQEVRKLQFMQRLQQEMDELEEDLVHASQNSD
jgi:molecular chaperone HscB